MMRRRRPLLRAVAVGGGAYMAGKAHARNQAERESYEADQDARISDLEAQQGHRGAPAQAAPPGAPGRALGAAPGVSLGTQMADLGAQPL